jgi:tRNA(Ile)-lysidine synthase
MDCKLEFAIENFFAELDPVPRCWVAYSGGMDSHVLLRLLASLRNQLSIDLHALHINHGLSPHASDWALHCETVCRALQIDYHQKNINAVAPAGHSPEAYARELRYAAFAEMLAPGDFIFCAQHQDDQAETVLLQMIRGAGLKGLAAMPVHKSLGSGWQVRPLLEFTRADLAAYAVRYELQWVEDESNLNKSFSRNYLRHAVLPVLKNRWPSVSATLSRTAAHCMEAQTILEEVALIDRALCAGTRAETLSAVKLKILSDARQSQVLRLWLREQNIRVPGTVNLQQIQRDLLHSRQDKTPHVAWHTHEVRRYRDDIYCMPRLSSHNNAVILYWDAKKPLVIPSVGILKTFPACGAGLKKNLTGLTIRFRQGGEVCRLPKRDFTHSLKKLLWEWNIPPWERDRLPLLFVEDELAAVPGYFVSPEFAAGEQEEGHALAFETIR